MLYSSICSDFVLYNCKSKVLWKMTILVLLDSRIMKMNFAAD